MIEASQQGAVVYSDKTGGAERFVLTPGGDLEVRDGTQHLVAVGQKIAAFGPMGVPKPVAPVAPVKQVAAAKPAAPAAAPVVTAAPSLAPLAIVRVRTAVVKPTAAKITPPTIKPEPKAVTSARKGPSEPEWAVRIRR